ncbi:hypothetical protein SAMN02746041_00807 [Desulfacinum hydrothermale DSM 13146]|uniref:Uncharacterized protein n=1 Tax=Desulfacinum hydrothermale DSM 13146 TaxID=1121390 RepID=A0A1W1X9A2_9BACT|nr:hypothetical protein [Desulfacinum hydrothermale]SMC20091.1 hypothetical protein SAMN02746041_00807 [Desulfacinum hydrothermale DSM 13146]
MGGLMDKVMQLVKRLGYLAMEYVLVVFYWKMRFLKVQMKRFSVAKAQKHLEKAYSGLGAVVYGMLREGSDSIQEDPAVGTQMKNVQEAEEQVKEVDRQIQAIHDEFAAKRQELKEKYQAKRTPAEQAPSEAEEEE